MPEINPQNFEFPEKLLKKVMKLSDNAIIIQNGYENKYPKNIRIKLQENFDLPSMIIRGTPDFQIYDLGKFFLVESKEDARAIEVIPLLLNKIYSEKTGIPIYYCFRDSFTNVKDMSLEPILVPLTHADDFKKSFESWFIEYGIEKTQIIYLKKPIGGSGDPFVLNENVERKKLEGF